ncbi:LEA type 2 family protein [Sediminibacterium sp. C3]|uniref:LEA type 2 family protein n=1 Tax=Sediminibacterium sp. C3 TaxID=1267211 RepID=UPI0004120E88|nr:LEA type 2 family protein [Sediminibacterium sp. C3]
MKSLPLYLFLAFIFVGCAAPKELEYRKVQNIEIKQLGFNQSKLNFELVYFNPNKFGLDLKKVDSDVYIDNTYLGKFQLDTLMKIPRNSEFVLPSSININMQNLYKNAAQLLFKKELTIKAKGDIKIGKGGIFKTFPFTYEGRQEFNLFK